MDLIRKGFGIYCGNNKYFGERKGIRLRIRNKMKVGVIGIGSMGRNHVRNYSELKEVDELIKKHGGKNLIATPRYEDAVNCNTFIILVPLFILETTVPPMTTETLVRKWLEEESGLALRLRDEQGVF